MVESEVVTTLESDAPKVRTAINYCEPVELGVAHHWDIEPPNGPTSMGMCRGCGAERVFRNSTEDISSGEWRNAGSVTTNNAHLDNSRADRKARDTRLSDE